jgi:hypothetical protein
MLLTAKRFWTVIICVVIFTLNTHISIAQVYQINIEWQSELKAISTIDGKILQLPTFKNAAHLESASLLPHFVTDYQISNKGILSAEITGAVYSLATGIDAANMAYINESIAPSVSLSIEKKRPFAHVQILPFRINISTGQIEKLESFTLKIINRATPQLRDSRSNYASSSVLSSGNWYKVAIANNGIYKIDFNFIKTKLGVEPSSVSMNKLAVFGNGGGMVPDRNSVSRADDLLENPTFINDANGNNRFDDGDYILFYADGADKWRFNTSTNVFNHEKNLYSDKNYYFITTTNGTGKRANPVTFSGPASNTFSDFNDFAFHESDEETLLMSGKDWLGDKMTNFNNTKSFAFNFPNIVSSSPATFISRVGAKTSYGSNTTASINGQSVNHVETGIPSGSYPPAYKQLDASINFNPSSSQLNVSYNFSATTDPTGTAASYIDFFEIHVKRNLSLTGDWMSFRNIASVGVGNNSEFRVGNMAQGYRVWDVSDPGTIKELTGSFSGSNFSFISPTPEIKEFVAFNPSGSFPEPEYVEKTANQDLHAIGEPDMIIVTHADFTAAAEKLADFHRTNDGISVGVVQVNQIYNEFGSGRKDISAIRDFMKMLYDRAGTDTAQMPRYLLLFGDGSFDPKNRVAGNQEFVPAYESYQSINQITTYTSDDFFVLLDENEGGDISVASQKLDAAVGRIPVGNATEAMDVVNKIILYKSRGSQALNCNTINNNGSWKNMITFIADDGDNGGNAFINASDQLSEIVRTQYPAYNIDKIYLDAFKQVSTPAGDRYPDVNTAILNRINSGTLVLNWVGHGGETNWAHERVFNKPDIIVLDNKEKLPLFVTATCDFSRFDIPDRTAGEWLVVNKNGGSIASITTVRLVYSSANDALNGELFKHLFELYEGRLPTIGELLTRTKNLVQTDITNSRKFVLLGDPALTLNYPRYDVVTTQVNDVPITQPHDTLKALAKVTIKGEVRDDNGAKMLNFNGVVYPVVYDKLIILKTLKNDAEARVREFSLYKSILFKGKASVTAGDFSFTFIVPKDMNYQYGNGRISYYADNNSNMDAHGYTNSIVIGGSADSFTVDNGGPQVSLYMNDENFVFGGTTNESPLLLAKLKDESGINTSGNGIGHDLSAVLDENTQNMVILNDYYESELDDYQKGNIRYPFRKLTEGRHTLRMKAWDIHNNSSEEYTEFVVASSAKLALSHVYNYPNPFTTRTQFMFEHNKPCEDLNVTIQIYTVSGKVVKTLHDEVTCEGYRVNDIEWDGLDDYGQPIGKGVYVYKLNVRASNGDSAHKFEKLVLLR